jgi:elongation factor Ts
MGISAQQVKELREKTGVGMMDCKNALVEAGGDNEKALRILREKGMAAAARKSTRTALEGLVGKYIHAGGKLGVLVEVNCETDFVARTSDFQELVRDVAMHIAASNPLHVSSADIPEEEIVRESEIYRSQAEQEGKPDHIADKIVEGRLKKYYSEVCLYDQAFVKDPDITVEELVKSMVAKLGENILVRRFARFKVGE